MSSALKHFFIPHAENNYHPHALHHKRILFYGFLGIAVKTIAVITALLLPAQAFVIPEVLVFEQQKIIDLTNEVRSREGVQPLVYAEQLGRSSFHKAGDMARKNYFEHVNPDGKRLRDFLKDVGYSYTVAGENLAVGFSSPEAMVEAWVESPTHFANLIDSDFTDIGVGSAVGMYGTTPALYVAQHFGKPHTNTAVATADPRERVRGEMVAHSDESTPYYDVSGSHISWKNEHGSIELHAVAHIVGNANRVVVHAQGYDFELYDTHENNIWAGTVSVSESFDAFFKAVLSPEITITWSDAQVTHSTIAWEIIPVVSMSTSHKYELARFVPQVLGELSPASQGVLYGILAFFTCALFLKIFIQIRHQHYRVIASTLMLIGLISLLIFV